MPADRKILAAAFAAVLMLSAGPARAALGRPTQTAPAEGAVSQFLPSFAWTSASAADTYEFQIAADPGMNSPVLGEGKDDFFTRNTRAALLKTVPNGTYYWRVRTVGPDGSVSAWTSPRSFTKNWTLQPVTQTPTHGQTLSFPDNPIVLRWSAVPGAAQYLVSVASDPALGSLVFKYSNQDDPNGPPNVAATNAAISNALAPGTYYWAVQPLDAEGNKGVSTPVASFRWVWPSATVPVVTDLDSGTPGYQTEVPVVTWNPVHGASSYEVDVTVYESGICNWSALPGAPHWRKNTAVPAWTPLGDHWNNVKPYSDPLSVANDGSIQLLPGTYCVRVRARTDRDTGSQDVYGDYTYLDDGTGNGTAFEWTGYPTPVSGGCNGGYPCSGDYLTPITGSLNRHTPYFTWNSMSFSGGAPAQSYFELVAKDANFTTIVDYGFTHIPAYAPRTGSAIRTYSDETTSYYWAVLPAQNYDGGLALGNPLLSSADNFQKQSLAPNLLYPAAGQLFYDQPTFRWGPADGARRYRFQVASDTSFSNLLDDVTTDGTSYSSNTTYPADTVLYWRVRADDENLVGLSWSATGMFQKKLAAPVPSSQNPTSGDMLPVWAWSPVQGASSYDVSVDLPDGTHHFFSGFRTPVASFIKMTATGVFSWRVRAEFPSVSGPDTPGPYSATQTFTRTIGEPLNLHTDSALDHVLLSWDLRLGSRQYKVQVASDQSFSHRIEEMTTDNASYAPLMTQSGYAAGGTLYWRVAAVDEDRNQGDWSPTQTINLQPRIRLSVSGVAKHGRKGRLTVRVSTYGGKPLARVRVIVTGKGIKARSGRTNARGKLVFTLKPRRRATLTFRATYAGYQATYATVKVR